MSQILVLPSSEKVANIELSNGAQILWGGRERGRGREGEREGGRERGREEERDHQTVWPSLQLVEVLPIDRPFVFIDVSNQLTLWSPSARKWGRHFNITYQGGCRALSACRLCHMQNWLTQERIEKRTSLQDHCPSLSCLTKKRNFNYPHPYARTSQIHVHKLTCVCPPVLTPSPLPRF